MEQNKDLNPLGEKDTLITDDHQTIEKPVEETTVSKEKKEDVEVNSESEKKNTKSFFGKKPTKEDKLKEQIEKLEIEKNELNDKFLRLFSEFDNYKKRTNKEKIDLIATASEKVILSLLPIIDDYERAIQYNQNVEDIAVLKEGFELIYNKMRAVLKRFDVEEITAIGEPFNTDFHEAITHFPAPSEDMKGKVMDVSEKGYKLKDKVIRFSKVIVAN
ncbi:MAG TPA: nucleotide exchange factor GrpE [Bacteroidales bacterium]|nr:nucleotide exchange factor GrpE [Bacteroidales bacterium]